ncbi:MAG: response regulator [Bacterioplanes sp.]|nr:response regulator [Bacterioplanes sp.]
MSIKHALVVDDSKSARIMLQRLLTKMNVQTETVDSAEAALTFLETTQPDVIFMDHMMPGMDGLEATQLIRANPKTATIPTIMYTSKEGEDYITMARSHGAHGVLAKPANQDAVMAVIQALDEPAANDENSNNAIALAEVDHLIRKHLKLAIAEAKAEVSAGLDSSTQQLQAQQSYQLDQIRSQLLSHQEQQLANLTEQLDAQQLFKRTQLLNQRLAAAVADKLIKKSADDLVAIVKTHRAEQQAALADSNVQLEKKAQQFIQRAVIKAALIGAAVGGLIGVVAAVLL